MIPEWLEREVAAYDVPLKHKPATVLDIGANVGAFSLRAAATWPDAQIFAYEPVPQNAAHYREFCNSERFHLTEGAVRGFDGVGIIHATGNLNTRSSFNLAQPDKELSETTAVSCIDASDLPACEFVKIDTEGCEIEILEKLDLSNAKAVAVEYHSTRDKEEITSILESKGYQLWRRTLGQPDTGVLKFIRKGEPMQHPRVKLFVALPIYGGVDPNFFCSAMKMVAEFGVNTVIHPLIGDSLVSRARNGLTRMFLESDCTHLLFIDSDLVFSTDHIKRILSHDEDIVGGFYPKKKQGDAELVCNALDNCPNPIDEARRLTQLKYIGTGFMCIKREVFERMIEAYGKDLIYTCDHDQETKEYDFWTVGVYQYPDGNRRYLSEDWYFCQRALDLGYKVWGDNGILCRHSGSAVYPLLTQEASIFNRVAATSTADSAVVTDSPLVDDRATSFSGQFNVKFPGFQFA